MWVVAGKAAAKVAAKAVAKQGGDGQAPKKKRWPLYLGIGGTIAAFLAVILMLVGNMVTAFVAAITGTTTVVATDCGVDRGRVSAFGSAGGSLAGVKAGSLAIPMASGTYTISSGWGMREGGMHNGSDFAAPLGTPIYAAADGEVMFAGAMSGYGHAIVIQHNLNGQRVDTLYGHMFSDGVLAKVGDRVRGGQHIANVGNDGDSSGPHLHLSLHPGAYTGYSSGVDPMPWLSQDLPSAPSGRTDFLPVNSPPPAPGADPFLPLTTPAGGELAPLPASKGTENGMQVNAVRVMRSMSEKFPAVTTIGGLRPGDPGEHGLGRAVDVMIPNPRTADGDKLGDDIVAYLQEHKDAFHIENVIWQQRLWDGTNWSSMEDRHSDTQNHFDHVHVTLLASEMASADTKYGPLPGHTQSTTSAILATNSTSTTADCIKPTAGGGGAGLADGSVPEKYRQAVIAAGAVCPEIKPPLIAAQIEQESGWQESVTSAGDGVNSGGAQGMAQFMPGTWATMGVDSGLDRTGRPEPPNAPDPFNPFDAIAAQGKYMCYIVGVLKPHIESGKVKGDIVDLALAGYNAGEGAVIEYGGIPPYGQTQAYVPGIRGRMAKYEASINASATPGGGGPAITVAGSPFARAMIDAASRYQGLPYVWGGGDQNGPTTGVPDPQNPGGPGFDCSGLVLYGVAQASGHRTILPRTTWGQIEAGTAVSKENIQPGDAVYSNNTAHVSIWLGDGKVLEAQTFGVPVGVYPFDLNKAENIRRFG